MSHPRKPPYAAYITKDHPKHQTNIQYPIPARTPTKKRKESHFKVKIIYISPIPLFPFQPSSPHKNSNPKTNIQTFASINQSEKTCLLATKQQACFVTFHVINKSIATLSAKNRIYCSLTFNTPLVSRSILPCPPHH